MAYLMCNCSNLFKSQSFHVCLICNKYIKEEDIHRIASCKQMFKQIDLYYYEIVQEIS